METRSPPSGQPVGDQASMPRRLDPDKTEHRATRDDEPTDPWFDRPRVATDDQLVKHALTEERQVPRDDERLVDRGLFMTANRCRRRQRVRHASVP